MSKKRKPYRQVAITRKRLQNALIDLLREKAYRKITISSISERADLARRTFYEHFESRDELLLSIVDDVVTPFFSELAESIIATPLYSPDSEHAFITLFEHWHENREILRLIRQAENEIHMLHKLKDFFLRIYHEAVLPKGDSVDVEIGKYVVDYLAGATFMILTSWEKDGMRQSPETMGKVLFTLIGPPSVSALRDRFASERVF